MLQKIKSRCGIADAITIYDDEIKDYIDDGIADMKASGVPESLINEEGASVLTAITLYVKAYIGSDRTDTSRYLDLYRKKVFRLALEEGGS